MRNMNILSIVTGIVVLIAGLVAFVPLLGWLYWVVIPLGIIGIVLGALSSKRTGLVLNLILVAIFFIRWSMGGFVL